MKMNETTLGELKEVIVDTLVSVKSMFIKSDELNGIENDTLDTLTHLFDKYIKGIAGDLADKLLQNITEYIKSKSGVEEEQNEIQAIS